MSLADRESAGFAEGNVQNIRDFAATSLVDLVTGKLRSDIFSGKYLPGHKLIVRELSADIGVSHTPIKEALNRLIAEGLVEAFPKRSMIVRRFTNADLIDNIAVRLMCELFYAEAVVEAAASDATVLQRMGDILEAMRKGLNENTAIDYEAWVANETAFHRSYMNGCGLQKLVEIYSGLESNKFTYFAYLCNEKTPLTRETFLRNVDEHNAIMDALRARDVSGFRNAVATHLLRACEDYAIDAPSRKKIAHIGAMVRGSLPTPAGAGHVAGVDLAVSP